MSRVWCTRAAAALGALVVLVLPGGAAGPPRASEGPEPVRATGVLSVSVSPTLVPPGAPVDVTVRAAGLPGHEAEVQVLDPSGWTTAGWARLDARGRATVRLSRAAAWTYRVRAVVAWAAGVTASSGGQAFTVTTRGLGDPNAYRYLYVSRGAPARWNPCAVVTYRVNDARARPTALGDLREALRRVTYETGVRFRELGRTSVVPGAPGGFRYEADLVVAWTDAKHTEHLGGQRAGAGGFEPPVDGRGGRPRIHHAFVVVDVGAVKDLDPGFGAGRTEGQVLLHELGHVMGLDHVDAEHQMMRPELTTVDATLYGAGDLTGLRRIGRRAGCL